MGSVLAVTDKRAAMAEDGGIARVMRRFGFLAAVQKGEKLR
jgi:hypothetical protein